MNNQGLYTIRLARADELSLLREIEHRAGMLFASTRHDYICSAPDLPLEVLETRSRLGVIFVAVDRADKIIGFAVAGELDSDAYLQEVDVEPSYGRRGIGRRLVGAVIEWASQKGFPSVILSTFSDVPWNAPFYARLGFQIVPEKEITPAMREIRNAEEKAGMLIASRVFMRRTTQVV